MSYAKRIAKGGAIIFFMTVLASCTGYLLRLFLARNLSVSDFGLFYSVAAFISFFWLFKDLGIGQAIVKFIPEYIVKKKYNEMKSLIIFSYGIQYIIGIAIFFPLFFFSDYIAINFFHNIAASPIIKILSLEFLITATITKNILQGFQKINFFASIEFFRTLIIFILLFFFIPISVSDVAISYLVASLFLQIIFMSYIFSQIKNYRSNIILKKFDNVFKFGFAVFVSGIAGWIIAYTDTLVITFFRSIKEVGLYQVALPTSQLLWIFVASLSWILFPVLSEMWAKNHKKHLSKGIGVLLKISFIFIIPFALIIISFPELILNIVFGGEYREAALSLQVLSVGAIFYTLMTIFSTILNAIGKPQINTKIIILVATFNLIFNIIFVPLFGIIGAAVTSLLSYIIGFLLSVNFSKKYITINIKWISLAKTFILGVVSLILIYVIKGILIMDPIAEAIISLILILGFYAFIIIYKILDKDDFEILRSVSPRLTEKLERLRL